MSEYITPAETMTAYALIGGIAAGIGGILLSQKIKTSTAIPTSSLVKWAVVLGGATWLSVYLISKSADKQP